MAEAGRTSAESGGGCRSSGKGRIRIRILALRPTGADYPAAHSMDLFWYAIDREGHVARFNTRENGHAPRGAEEASVIGDLWDAAHGRASHRQLDDSEIAARLGFFLYEYGYDYDPIAPYDRRVRPESPIHIDQLPPAMREICKRVLFEGVSFTESERIQPLEYFACSYWYGNDRVAYLAEDGKTVRPIPGMEERFAEFCETFREQHPEESKQFRFEGIDEAPSQGEP